MDVEIERVASAFSIVGDRYSLYRRPAADDEVVRDDAGAFLQLAIENGLHLDVRFRQQVNGNQIGRGVILLEHVTLDDAGVLQSELADFRGARLHKIVVEFDTDGIGPVLARGHDDDTPVTAAEVEHLLTGLEPAELE